MNDPKTIETDPHDRQRITQEIASMMSKKFDVALVTDTSDGLRVQAHRADKAFFLEATLRRHPAITDSFALKLWAKFEGEYLTEELDAKYAQDQAKIAIIPDLVEVQVDRAAMRRKCVLAKLKGTMIRVEQCDDWEFRPSDLRWLVENGVRSLMVTPKGVAIARRSGEFGDYDYYCRGKMTDDGAAAKRLEAEPEAKRLQMAAEREPLERQLAEVREKLRLLAA